MVALVQLDLEVQGFGRLAGAPQAVDVRSVPASEVEPFQSTFHAATRREPDMAPG